MFLGGFPHQLAPAVFGHLIIDLICAVPYTIHFILPIVFVSFLILKHRKFHLTPFVFCFGLMNLSAVLTQLLFPTSPPWYYEKFGFTPADYEMDGDAARLIHLDTYFETNFYTNMYKTSPL